MNNHIKNKNKYIKTNLLILAFIQYFILIMLIIGSCFEIEKLLLIYKEKEDIDLFDNLRSLLILISTIIYLIHIAKEVFNKTKKEKSVK